MIADYNFILMALVWSQTTHITGDIGNNYETSTKYLFTIKQDQRSIAAISQRKNSVLEGSGGF